MPPSEIRKEAREALAGKWGKGAFIILAFILFNLGLSIIQSFFILKPAIYALMYIAITVISIPLSFGLLISFMKLKRGEEVTAFGFLKAGFSNFGRAWGIWFHTFLRLLLPVVCFIIIMLVLGFAAGSLGLNTGLSLITTVVYVACMVYLMSRALLYAIAYYLGYDNPELSSKECVLKSAELMKGNRGNLFLLGLSFIGWAILAVIPFGIGILWLAPYMQVATICFYERVAGKVSAE